MSKKIRLIVIISTATLGIAGLIVGTMLLLNPPGTDKLICTSKQGDITLIYNDKKVIDYKSKDITYDLKEQQKYSETIGVNAYIKEFGDIFKSNLSGECKKK